MAKDKAPKRVLLDASALIGLIQGDPEFAVLKSLLQALENGEARLVESTAIFVEVLPNRSTDLDPSVREDILTLLRGPDVEIVDVNLVVASKAAVLRTQYGLKTWDAIHIATAIVTGADVVIGRDRKFPDGEVVEGVSIREPYDIFEDRLPFDTL